VARFDRVCVKPTGNKVVIPNYDFEETKSEVPNRQILRLTGLAESIENVVAVLDKLFENGDNHSI